MSQDDVKGKPNVTIPHILGHSVFRASPDSSQCRLKQPDRIHLKKKVGEKKKSEVLGPPIRESNPVLLSESQPS